MESSRIKKEIFFKHFTKPILKPVGEAERTKSIMSVTFAMNGLPTPADAHLEVKFQEKKSGLKIENNDISNAKEFFKMFSISYTKKEQKTIINAGYCLSMYLGMPINDVYTIILTFKDNYQRFLESKKMHPVDYSLLSYAEAINKHYEYKEAPKELLDIAHAPYPDFDLLNTNVRNVFTAKAEKMTFGWGKKPYDNPEEAYDFLQKRFNEKINVVEGRIAHKEVVFNDEKMTKLFAIHMSKDVTSDDVHSLPNGLFTRSKSIRPLTPSEEKSYGKVIKLG